MKPSLPLLLPPCLALAGSLLAQDPPAPAGGLARPLRKYDTDKDGRLTGEELRLARQAFNRGGRAPEMSADDWQGVLDYFKGEWRRRQFSKLDLNSDGKLDDAEKERLQAIWKEIAAQLTAARAELVLKHDQNDDGNVTRGERRAFDPEFNRRRQEIETSVLAGYATPPAPPSVPAASPPAGPAPAAAAPPGATPSK